MKRFFLLSVFIAAVAVSAHCGVIEDISGMTVNAASDAAAKQAANLIGGLTAGALIWGLIFSSIGVGFFLYGKKRHNMKLMLVSAVLVGYPYVVKQTVEIILIGAGLTVVAYLARK